jgi:hypothetical protein
MTLRKLDRSGGASEPSTRISVTSSSSVSCVRTVLMTNSVLRAGRLVVPRSTDLSWRVRRVRTAPSSEPETQARTTLPDFAGAHD